MTSFNNLIKFTAEPMAAVDHYDEFQDMVRERLDRDIEERAKATLDPGIDPKRASQVASLKVKSEGSRFVIKTDDSAAALAFAEAGVKEAPPSNEAGSVEELFEMSSGVPQIKDGKLIYKTVSMDSLFGSQSEEAQNQQLESVVEDTIRNKLPDAYTEAFSAVARKHPTVK